MADIVDKAQELIDRQLGASIEKARKALADGEETFNCLLCGDEIGQARREAMPNTKLCISCASDLEG